MKQTAQFMEPLRVQAGNMGHLPWDPKCSEPVRWAFNAAVFSPLVHFNKQYQLNPGILLDWQWNEADNSYTIRIDRSLEFGNGRHIEVEDVEFAIVKPFISSFDMKEKQPLKIVVGLEGLKSGSLYKTGSYEGFKKLSAESFKIFLSRPDPTFLYSLGISVPPVGPREAFKADMYTFKTYPDGSGYYKISRVDKETGQIHLARKEKYRTVRDGPPNEILFFTQMQGPDNQVDLGVMAGARGTKDNPHYTRFVSEIPVAVQVLDFNYNNRYGRNKRFREALSLAIDRVKITEGHDQASPLHELVPRMFYGRSNKKFKHDPRESEIIVKNEFPLLYRKSGRLRAWYHGVLGEKLPNWLLRMKSQFADVGIDIEFIGTDEQKMTTNKSDIVFYVYGTPITFVDPLLPFSFYTKDTVKTSHTDLSDKTYNLLYKVAQKAKTREDRASAIAKLSEYLQKNFLAIPIAERRPIFAYSKRVKDFGKNNLFYTFDYEKIRTKQ